MTVRIVLVEPQALIRQAIRYSLPDGYSIILESASAKSLVRTLMDLRPEMLICSSIVASNDATVEVCDAIESMKHLKVLMLIDGDGAHQIAHFIKCGVRGLVSKNASTEDVRAAILQVGGGGQYFCSEATDAVAEHIRKPAADVNISPREWDVLRLVNNGLQTKAIATALDIRAGTVGGYRKSLMKRLGATNAVELIHAAKRLGLID